MVLTEELSDKFEKAPSFLKPKLKLFLSVDIVGSTAYKQTSRAQKNPENSPIEPWVLMVTHFYQDFPTHFLTERSKLESIYRNSTEGWVLSEEPSLWKAAGDELIYTITLTDSRHAVLFIAAWVAAVKSVRKMLAEQYSNKLTLKATGWLAGFPVANSEVYLGLGEVQGGTVAGSHINAADQNMLKLNELYKKENKPVVFDSIYDKRFVDFIGPSLDIGFRLASYATPRRFVCSVELAWLVCEALGDDKVRKAHDLAENCSDNIKPFHISERHLMKGVLDGIPYPIIWIDTGEHKEFNSIEDEIFNNVPVEKDKLTRYCVSFITSCNADHLFIPFISGKTGKPSEQYLSRYAKLLGHWEKVHKDHLEAIPKIADNKQSVPVQQTPNAARTLEEIMKAIKAIKAIEDNKKKL